MSVGSVVKKVITGAPGAAKSVAESILGDQGLGVAPSASAPAAVPDMGQNTQAALPEWKLPELDPNDPDYEEKKAVQDAYMKLNDQLTASMKDAGINADEKYAELAKYAASQPQPRKWSPFSAFAIAMGSPAGAEKVASDNAAAEKAAQDREEYLLNVKEQAIKGDIAQQMEAGNYRKALAQSEALAELQATQNRIADQRKAKAALELAQTQNAGKIAVAQIKAKGALEGIKTKINSLADTYKLSAQLRQSMLSFASHALTGFQTARDAAGEPVYSSDDIHQLMNTLVDYAEEHSPIFMSNSATGNTKTVTPSGNEGPPKNDAVAEKFAQLKKAREAAGK